MSSTGSKRRDRRLPESEHDPYRARGKAEGNAVCEDCGAVVVAGRWQSGEAPEGARKMVCPACRRTRDGYPAGILHVRGPFYREHADEIRHLVHHEAEAARGEHVLQRLMSVEETEDGLDVTTTDAHLARRIGNAIERAYQGNLRLQYVEGDTLLRAWWER